MLNSSFCFLGDVEEVYENLKKFVENFYVDILKVCRLFLIFIIFFDYVDYGSFENREI